jgi:hypothetical protein
MVRNIGRVLTDVHYFVARSRECRTNARASVEARIHDSHHARCTRRARVPPTRCELRRALRTNVPNVKAVLARGGGVGCFVCSSAPLLGLSPADPFASPFAGPRRRGAQA